MRVIEEIPIHLIKVDRFSISPETLSIVDHIRDGGELPPISVQYFKDGTYKLKDGRHRITAHKLLGIRKIKAKFFKNLQRTEMSKIEKIENFISKHTNAKFLNIIDDCIIIEYYGSGEEASKFSDILIDFIIHDKELEDLWFTFEFKE